MAFHKKNISNLPYNTKVGAYTIVSLLGEGSFGLVEFIYKRL